MKKRSKKSTEEILEQAHQRFKLANEAEQEIRREALEDFTFRKGEQWPSDVKNARAQENRPTLVINKMPQFVRNVTNDQKQNRPAIKVSPYDDQADVDTAQVMQGIIRNIENISDAEYAYDKAFEGAATGGFGYFRIVTEYVDAKSFEQELRVEMIDNQFKATLDPYSVKPDGSDAKWGFIWDTMTKDEFKAEYGESALAKHDDWEDLGRNYKGWCGQDEVRIAEYFYKENKRVKLLRLSDGEVYFQDELPDANEDGSYSFEMESVDPLTNEVMVEMVPFTVDEERWTVKTKVKWLKMNAIDILEETEFPGSYIPIIPVYGDCLNIDGEVIRESVIRHAKDSQRILNYWASTEAETITLAPKAPWIGAEGQFEGHEQKWAAANVKNFPYLEYNPTTHEGQMVPAPQRNAFEPPVMAVTNARMQANEDIKATTGIYDASLGGRSNEASGLAIQRRNQQSQTSNFHLVDNLAKSIRHAGRIMVEIIPKIYDTDRIVRILGIDGEEKMVRINADEGLTKDQKRGYNFTYGKYDVSVSTGPSYETKRQEARDAMLTMSSQNSKFAEVAGDLLVKNMDFPGADDIAARIKKTLPPELVGNEDDEIPPQAKAAMNQMQQQIQMLGQQLQASQQIIQTDAVKIKSDEKIAAMKVEADLKKELIKIAGDTSEQMLQHELAQIDQRWETLQLGVVDQMQQVIPPQGGQGPGMELKDGPQMPPPEVPQY